MPQAENNTESGRVFPTDDALCEQCGYPLRGLPGDTHCPECGLAVSDSSPAKRRGVEHEFETKFFRLMEIIFASLFDAKATFRAMPIDGSLWKDRLILLVSALMAASAWGVIGGEALEGVYRHADWLDRLVPLAVIAMTYIEMIGVTAFSRRRGWRVPFSLAERVCCRAAVGWFPGIMLAGLGMWVLKWVAIGEPWFEQPLGIVRVGWLFFALLFVSALLWFETFVWIGVRQVKYANAWPEQPIGDPPHAPEK